MSERTGIAWCDSSWNPLRGEKGKWSCVRVSPGCKNCFAATLNQRFGGPDYVVGADELRLDETALALPLRWKKPRRIFVCSMTDLFEERVKDQWIDRIFAVMALNPQHTFQVLSKRAERMRSYMVGAANGATRETAIAATMDQPLWLRLPKGRTFPRYPTAWPLANVHLGVSVEDQARADERIPFLLQTPAAVRFVSIEPLLGPVDLDRRSMLWRKCATCGGSASVPAPGGGRACPTCFTCPGGQGLERALDWVIVGAETGRRHRPMQLAWLESIVAQCQDAKVPIFVKQASGSRPGQQGNIPDHLWKLKEFPL